MRRPSFPSSLPSFPSSACRRLLRLSTRPQAKFDHTQRPLRLSVLCVVAFLLLLGLTGCGRKANSTAAAKQEPLPVAAFAFSPDGKKLVGCIGPEATVWDVDSGKPLTTLEDASPGVSPLAFSADGQSIAGGHGKTVRIWDAFTGKVRKSLEGHSAGVSGVGFSADGK